MDTASQGLSLLQQHGALGAVVLMESAAIVWLARDRKSIVAERDKMRHDRYAQLREDAQREHQINIVLTAQLETVRNLQERMSTRKGFFNASKQ